MRCRFGWILSLFGVAALGCGTKMGDPVLAQAAIPGTYTNATLEFVAERAGYLDAYVDTGGIRYRFLFPADDACRAVVESEAPVRYAQNGPLGRLAVDDQHCDAVGVLSLREWRNRRGRSRGGSVVPRAQATYEVFYRDSDVAFARGRFPLAGRLGILGGQDHVAVFQTSPECEGVLDDSVATMEFRDGGGVVLALVGSDGLCPFLGLALPLPGGGDADDPDRSDDSDNAQATDPS